ncbi:MAG: AsmA-like C-terminal region-containing protein [Planctomycetota bacterium]
MRSAARILGRGIRVLGWTVFFSFAILFLAEKTGLVTAVARRVIASRLGEAGAQVRVGEVRLGWFDPSVRLSRLELGPNAGLLSIDEARVHFEVRKFFSSRPLHVAGIDLLGGRVSVSQPLLDSVQAISSKLPQVRSDGATTWAIPPMTVRGLVVDLQTARLGKIPIGRVDAVVRRAPSGPPVLRGRLVPSLSSDPDRSGEIIISGQEFEPGAFDVQASAAGVPISTDDLPAGTEIEGLRAYAPRATLEMRAFARFRLDGATPPRGTVRLALTETEIALEQGRQKVGGLRLDLDAEYEPASRDEALSPLAWRTRARMSGRWQDVPFEALARLEGPASPSPLLDFSLHVERLPATHELLDLIGNRESEENLWQALDPRGEVELWLGLRCPREWSPDEPIGKALSAAAEIGLSERAGLTFRGWESRGTAQRDQGFPLPVDGVKGSVVYSYDPNRRRRVLVGIGEATGRSGGASVRVEGVVNSHAVHSPPYMPGHGYAEIDLRVRAEELTIDDRLLTALRGLSSAAPPASTWEPFNPSGGKIDAEVRVFRRVDMPYAATRVRLDFREAALAWAEVPAPILSARGSLEFLSDGRSERGLGIELHGAARTASDLRATIRYQTDPSVSAPDAGKPRIDQIHLVSVEARRMSLKGDDKKTLVSRFPWLGEAMDPHAPGGFADVAYEYSRASPEAPARTDAEIIAREAEVTPSVFRVPTSAVRGRVLVTAIENPQDGTTRTRTRLAPLVGVWSGDVLVSVNGSFPDEGLRVHAAGLDPANKGLLGALSQAIPKSADSQAVDLTAVSVEGPLDLTGEIGLAGEGPESNLSFRLFLRENSLNTSKNLRLDRMRGIVEVRGRGAYGRNIEASLAGTPLNLTELRYASTADGFEFTTGIGRVENVPLDRDHLRPFVDEKTLEALLGPLGWRGRIDIEEGRLRIVASRESDTRLEFTGRLTPSDMQVQLGLPLAVRSASATIEQLIYEGGRVRALCRIEDLYGTIAGRELSKASVLLTYVEPRLSIESIQGELEGGQLRRLGEGAERGGTAFSIDLEEPFPFQLALDLEGIELAGLLRGLFATNFATRGTFDCRLRLTGDTQRMLAIQGSGSVQISESRLWSVPVFRALFSQLGLDDQAVFDQMGANLRIKNGVLHTDDIWVSSPILELVGKGWIDFDGGVKHDLQVRYRLIDRLGPITRLLYAIQAELLSVAIRGDLARPRVIFKAPWTRISSDPGYYRSLPLPDFAPLPPRF